MFLLLFLNVFAFCQSSTLDTISNRLKRATVLYEQDKNQAFVLLDQTLTFSKKANETKGEWTVYETIGLYHMRENQFDKALEAFQQNVTLGIQMDSLVYEGIGYLHLGDTYLRIGRVKPAETNFLKALDIFQKIKNKDQEARTLGSLGNLYTQLGQAEKGLTDYQTAYQLFDELRNEDMKATMNLNIGYFYLMNGQGEAAIPYVKNGLEYGLEKGETARIAMSYGNLGYAYSLVGDYRQAFSNYQHCVDTAQKYNYTLIEHDTYKDMSETYQRSGNPIKALEYLNRYYSLKDSLIGQKTQERVTELEIQFETANQEREINEFKQQEKIHSLKIWLLTIGLLLLSIIGFLGFQKQRSDLRKKQDLIAKNDEIHRLEKELIDKELEQKALKQQKTEKELAYKTSRLIDFAIDIAQKNEFSNEVMNRLDNIEKLKLSKKASDELRKFRIYVSSQLQINDSLSTFQQNVDAVNLDFNQKLEQRFPSLSKKDLILCGLLRLNLQNKEIATLRNVSDNAIKMARYRLRKKLNLNAENDITDFLKGI